MLELTTYWSSVRHHYHYTNEPAVNGKHGKAFSNLQSYFTSSSLIRLILLIKRVLYKIEKKHE